LNQYYTTAVSDDKCDWLYAVGTIVFSSMFYSVIFVISKLGSSYIKSFEFLLLANEGTIVLQLILRYFKKEASSAKA